MPGNVAGFDAATVYRTYDEYVGDDERRFIEYFMRDAYEYYGYDFQWYDGTSVDEETADKWIDGFATLDSFILNSWQGLTKEQLTDTNMDRDNLPDTNVPPVDKVRDALAKHELQKYNANRKEIARILLRGLRFVNKRGQPLEFTPMLQPDPDLLDQPLYH